MSSKSNSPKQPKRSRPVRVADEIKTWVVERDLQQGDKLPNETEMIAQFGVSKGTVREAMRILKAYGLVEVRPKIGATITDNRMARAFELFSFNTMEVSRKSFTDVQAFRDLIEVRSADRIFEELQDKDLAELREINANLADIRDIQEASEVDYAFHVRLISILGNNAILDVYSVMKPIILRIMQKGKTRRTFMTETYDEHEGVIDAMAARDRLAFEYRLRNHLMVGFKNFSGEMEGKA